MHTQLPAWFEIGSFVVLGCILLFDLIMVAKRPHEPSMKEAGIWVGVYVALALVFGGLMFAFAGAEQGTQFVAGWITEYSLSIDNLFVFIVIMTRFAVPRKYQQEVLMVGIIIALVLRGIFILLGATIIANFSWVFYIFGVFLLWTAYHQAKDDGEDESEENALIRKLRTVVPMTDQYDGNKLRTTVNGKKLFTPMLVVFVTIGVTDLMFAFDSIPAIFGLTQSPFIVFTANIFALMGLRQLYFLLGGLMERLIYLKHGLSLILAFIGVKLILHAMHENEVPFINGGEHIAWAPEIPTFVSLGVIVAIIAVATVASMLSPKGRSAHAVAELHRAIEVYRGIPEGTPTQEIRIVQAELVKKHHAARGASERSRVELPDVHEHTGKTVEEHHTESRHVQGTEHRESGR
ncbi:TerC/Alx family metal homeostasis membrane protein [Kocuria sediminis]|uniref:TerC/Alx family metal homeostasis membrane protein n=1 Tax=Kocuria sediminis TaxID=1038857 RepID=A0A6N8GN33_9MICC|nr:TerC/Alx family metal homeostasis membrane protein [Kocuria sediminis]